MLYALLLVMLLVLLACAAALASAVAPQPVYDWAPVDEVIATFIANQSFPGCVAAIASMISLMLNSDMRFFTTNPPPRRLRGAALLHGTRYLHIR